MSSSTRRTRIRPDDRGQETEAAPKPRRASAQQDLVRPASAERRALQVGRQDLFHPRPPGLASFTFGRTGSKGSVEAWARSVKTDRSPRSKTMTLRRRKSGGTPNGPCSTKLTLCGPRFGTDAKIDRKERGCRHFGALTRRRGRHFGDGLVDGTHDARNHELRLVGSGAERVHSRRHTEHTGSSDTVGRGWRRNRQGTHTIWSGYWTWCPGRVAVTSKGCSRARQLLREWGTGSGQRLRSACGSRA